MRKVRTVVHYRGKLTEFDGWDVGVPGLVLVSQAPDQWVAIHAKSGASLGVQWSEPEAAVAAMRVIGDMHDWTRPIREWWDSDVLRQRVEATGDHLPTCPVSKEIAESWVAES